jgi:hypothetical protein
MQKQKLDEQAKELANDWSLLVKSGIDVVTVDQKMASSTWDYLQMAKKTGQEVPAAMKPVIQSMIDQGVFTDENGKKITDMGQLGIKFSETMTAGFDRIVARLDALLGKLGVDLPKVLNTAAADSKVASESIQADWVKNGQSVDRFNFGSSPGGLKEIPILLAQGVQASETASRAMVNHFNAMSHSLKFLTPSGKSDAGMGFGDTNQWHIEIHAIDAVGVENLVKRGDFQTAIVQAVARDGNGFGTKLNRALPQPGRRS